MSEPEVAPGAGPEGARVRRLPAEPPSMSVAEKLACEWEARHDVAARRRIADVAPVQHYLTHVRCEDGRHPSAASAQRAAAQRAAAQHGTAVPSGLRGWLRWGEDDGSAAPIIPRC